MKRTNFILTDKGVAIAKGKRVLNGVFSESIPVTIENKSLSPENSALNVVYVSETLYVKTGPVAILYCKELNKYIEVFCKLTNKIKGDTIQVTSTIYNNLSCSDNDSFYLLIYPKVVFSNVKTQKVDNIKEDVVVVSQKTIESAYPDFKNSKISLFSLHNSLTGENLIVKKSHIVVDPCLPEGSIRINRIQRTFLGFEFRDYIPSYAWDKLLSLPSLEKDDFDAILRVYDKETHIVLSSATYNDKMIVKKILNKCLEYHLVLCPVVESFCGSTKKSPLFKIADFYVGKSTLSLACRRPYEIDEGKDVVRLSKNSMNLLGISAMDQVRVTFKDKTVVCRALELEEKESFEKTNLPMSCDLIAGLPVNVRNKLGIMNIASCVKIDRDTPFIFRKSLNEQIVPVLLTLFSSNFITNFSVWKTAVVSLALAPIIVYFNLSSKRNMRLK